MICGTAGQDDGISVASIRERRLSHETPKETPMRILFGITVAAVLALSAWSIGPTVGEARTTVSIDPVGMMTTASHALPETQCDQGTIF